MPLPDAIRRTAIFMAGGWWALLLTLVIWRIYPFGMARRAVAHALDDHYARAGAAAFLRQHLAALA